MNESTEAMLASALTGGATLPELMEIAGFEGTEQEFADAFTRAFSRFADEKRVALDSIIAEFDRPAFKQVTLEETISRARFLLQAWRA